MTEDRYRSEVMKLVELMFLRILVIVLSVIVFANTCSGQFNPRAAPGHTQGDGLGWAPCCGMRLRRHVELEEVPGYTLRIGAPYAVRPRIERLPRCSKVTRWAVYYVFGTRLSYPQAYPWPHCNRRAFASMSNSPLAFAWVSPLFSRVVFAEPGGDLTATVTVPAIAALVGTTLWMQAGIDRWGPIRGPGGSQGYWDGRTHTWAATAVMR